MIKIKCKTKAILFGVDNSVIGNLELGNNYIVEKDSMINQKLWEEFDYTAFGIRRVYESAKINDNLEVAVFNRSEELEMECSKIDDKLALKNEKIEEFIFNYEKEQIDYIDKKLKEIRLYSENCINIKELLIMFEVINNETKKIILTYNSKIPFPDRIIDYNRKLHLNGKDDIKKINNYIINISNSFEKSKFSPSILHTAAILYDQSYTAPVPSIRFMVCVIGLESILVNTNQELSYRLSRNCAMLLSSTEKEYISLSKRMKEIYNKRSNYVHNGMIENLEESEIIEVRDILRKTIHKVLEKDISQEELLKELDLKGFIK